MNAHPPDLAAAHDHSSRNGEEIAASSVCRCFYCLESFPPAEVVDWVQWGDGNADAICPRCGIDSVIGSASGVDLSDTFFRRMSDYWFT